MRHHVLPVVIALLVLTGIDAAGQTLPTTRESDNTLQKQGLIKAASLYLLETDAKLQDDLDAVRRAQVLLTKNRRKRAEIQQVIQRAQNLARQWAQERADLNRQLPGTRDQRKYNEVVGEMNLRGDWTKEAAQEVTQRELELKDINDSPDEYIAQVLALSNKMEAAAKKYDSLAADESVQAALAGLNAGGIRKFRLGPSARFTDELSRRRKERGTIDSAVIKLTLTHGVPEAQVTLNGKLTQLMVVDSGASFVTITSEVAHNLGLDPGDNDPSIKLHVANGQEVQAKLVCLKSIRLAQFTVEDVDCAVLPSSNHGAPCLLGGTFLRHFSYKMDLAAGNLHISQLRDAASETPRRPATRPAVSGASSKSSPGEGAAANMKIDSYSWTTDAQNAPAVRMGGNDRVCALSSLRGYFNDEARIGMRRTKDGDWLLDGGQSPQARGVGGISVAVGATPVKWKVTQYAWTAGDPPVRMIHSRKGFCCLSDVGGPFLRENEQTKVYVDGDGFWCLGGDAPMAGHPTASAVAYEPPRGFFFQTQEFTWEQAGSAVRMIRQEDGFCYLSSMTGRFGRLRDEIRVFVGPDGWWYLDGKSTWNNAAATAVAVRIVPGP